MPVVAVANRELAVVLADLGLVEAVVAAEADPVAVALAVVEAELVPAAAALAVPAAGADLVMVVAVLENRVPGADTRAEPVEEQEEHAQDLMIVLGALMMNQAKAEDRADRKANHPKAEDLAGRKVNQAKAEDRAGRKANHLRAEDLVVQKVNHLREDDRAVLKIRALGVGQEAIRLLDVNANMTTADAVPNPMIVMARNASFKATINAEDVASRVSREVMQIAREDDLIPKNQVAKKPSVVQDRMLKMNSVEILLKKRHRSAV